jgi:predicted DCC family thiol-disulfide oxidoreductase YuxK
VSPILLFDGVCNFCNATVQFVLRHERDARLRFAPLQSDAAKRLLAERGVADDLSTLVLVDGPRAYTRSSAAVRMLRSLGGAWTVLAALLWVVPKPLRDLGYGVFARLRYRLFGMREACMVPSPEQRARFL